MSHVTRLMRCRPVAPKNCVIPRWTQGLSWDIWVQKRNLFLCPEMLTSTLTRLGRQVCFPRTTYRQKPVHSKIRLTHNVVPSVTRVEKFILDNIKVGSVITCFNLDVSIL